MVEHTPTLVRNLMAERREAAEELLVFVQSFAPGLFQESRLAADRVRANSGTGEMFGQLRDLYARVLDEFRQSVEQRVIEGQFESALEACDDLACSLVPRLRREILLQKGRSRDLARDERQGRIDANAAVRNTLRGDILATLQTLLDAANLSSFEEATGVPVQLEQETATSSPPPESLGTRVIIGAEPEIVLTCENVAKRYSSAGAYALRGISLQVRRGGILGVLGL